MFSYCFKTISQKCLLASDLIIFWISYSHMYSHFSHYQLCIHFILSIWNIKRISFLLAVPWMTQINQSGEVQKLLPVWWILLYFFLWTTTKHRVSLGFFFFSPCFFSRTFKRSSMHSSSVSVFCYYSKKF